NGILCGTIQPHPSPSGIPVHSPPTIPIGNAHAFFFYPSMTNRHVYSWHSPGRSVLCVSAVFANTAKQREIILLDNAGKGDKSCD
ncbi:hypothetical protein BgiBS90_000762, partial [Biomphalaria glabrata]